MLDYDGTLAPHRPRPLGATPAPGALERLERLSRTPGTTLAIVSGRRVEDLDAILGDLACYRAAEHGWEERLPDGRRLAHPIPAGAARALDAAAARAGILFPADRLERKRASIVLHTRGLPPAEARASERAARRAWRPLLRRAPLRLDAASGGLELRARGRDKGTVVRALLRPLPADTLPVCVGDDPSDEDAFAAVARRGVAIRVGREVRRSRARARLDSPRAVVGFLDRWLAIPSAAPAIRRAAR